MQNTVFYAWQSDLPNRTNRQLIRDALDDAIKSLNAEMHVNEAVRVDQDTAGVPGNPTVAEVIFSKIDECRAFVADITTITPADAKRRSPNPNVLIEYGRATVQPGDDCVVTVFNDAYGNWEADRPFDMKHKRKPRLYTLAEHHTSEQRREARDMLSRQFVGALGAILAKPHRSTKSPTFTDFQGLRADPRSC